MGNGHSVQSFVTFLLCRIVFNIKVQCKKNYSMVFKMLCEFHFAMFSIFRSTCLWLHCSAKDIRNGGNYPQKVASFVQCGWCWVCKSPLNKATFVIMQTDDAMCAQCTHNLHSFMMSSCAFVNLYNFLIAIAHAQ